MSATHPHLAAVLTTELATCGTSQTVRALDIGCGDGRLIGYLTAVMPARLPQREFTFSGFDVSDSGHVVSNFPASTVHRLAIEHPREDWATRVLSVHVGDPWPFPDGSMDVVYSNQVLEHVFDPDHFFGEHRRVLAAGGVGAHVFPLRRIVVEPHLGLPLIHWIPRRSWRLRLANAAAVTGRGRFVEGRADSAQASRAAEGAVDLLESAMAYPTPAVLRRAAGRSGLDLGVRFTGGYLLQKSRLLRDAPAIERYRRLPSAVEHLTFSVVGFVASVTIVVRAR